MISFASPIRADQASPQQQDTPSSTRSRRFAILPPPPSPRPDSPSPPVPVRSPLRPTPRTSVDSPPRDPAFSKRKHALIELLSTERAYASDLALIRDIHIPLALGQPAPFLTPSSPASPSSPSTTPLGPPMTKEDTKIIFGNVEELAVFSEVFCDKLEEALQGVLDPEGDGEERVGELFLSMIPHLKPPYTTYITRHPSAVAHLNALPQTPALTAYLAQTHTLAQSYTHAWDLPSLLIKPVQRLLKYPLLLSAIIDDTEPGESRDRLREACEKVQEVARGVNEGRRRWEVVKGLLEGKHPPPTRLKSIKSFKQQRSGSKDGEDQLERLEKRLHSCETFVHEFAKDVVDWTMSLRDAVAQLERWSATFGRVIGLGHPHGSEALDLFTDIVASQITPVWISLDAAIQSTLLPKLARLLATTAQPLLLISHMHALRPQHLQLLDAPLSKARPPASLLEASQSYLALEAQLRTELPRYLALLERGFVACVGQFADWQGRFWKEVRAQWVELWDALGVEGDMTAGAVETVKVWWDRWEEIDTIAAKFSITRPRSERSSRTSLQSHTNGGQGPTAALATAFVAGSAHGTPYSPPPSSVSSSQQPSANRRRSLQSIDLDVDMYGNGSSMTGSQEVNSPASYDTSMSMRQKQRRPSAATRESDGASFSRRGSGRSRGESESRLRRDSDRSSAAPPENDRPSVVRQDSDRPFTPRQNSERSFAVRRDFDRPAMARQQGERPSTAPMEGDRSAIARMEGERPGSARRDLDGRNMTGILKKPSMDSTSLMLPPSSPPTQSSPRLSVHTTESSSASGSSNHRHSIHSMELGSDAQFGQRAASSRTSGASITAQTGLRPYGTPSMAPMSEFGSRPVLPRSFPSSTSLTPDADGRGRVKKAGMRKRLTDAFRSPSKRPPSRPGTQSVPELPRHEMMDMMPPERAMYVCTVVHPFVLKERALPPYRGFRFLTLHVGDTVEVLSEQGHPRLHESLPIRPEDEDCEDCLLMARDERGDVGWAMASFLVIMP